MKVAFEQTPAITSESPPDRAAIQKVAREFEGLLMAEVMKAMRRTVPESSLGGGIARDVFSSMLDEELSGAASRGTGLGLADMLATQLGAETAQSSGEADQEIVRVLGETTWVAPVDGTTHSLTSLQSFGAYRPGERPLTCGAGHCGLDLARPQGTPIRAASDGVVTKIGRRPTSDTGLWVEISHLGGKVTTRYLHLSAIAQGLEPGSHVEAGSQLGEVGATGTTARGDHLHFELLLHRDNGTTRWVDPAPFLEQWRKISAGPQDSSLTVDIETKPEAP